ncbi:Ribonuclease P protein component [Candidatus Fokinia solitaria]|uniref:Ribonuclease P protein component n=2 Tax=Candidatus Fokinia solitaria TaxID=1802984 RepID=A0A2U8BST5_9RICK|nr:Ribonuclease P protein component [Candidatus Fokinia solitaria]
MPASSSLQRSSHFALIKESEYSIKSILHDAKRFIVSSFVMFMDVKNTATRCGYYFGTVTSKRVGNAVLRNHVKRLVREVARKHAKLHKLADKTIYIVLILRKEAAVSDIDTLYRDYLRAFSALMRKYTKQVDVQ